MERPKRYGDDLMGSSDELANVDILCEHNAAHGDLDYNDPPLQINCFSMDSAQEEWRADVAADAGRYPLDSAVEKAMLSCIHRLRSFNRLFHEKRAAAISMDLATMASCVSMASFHDFYSSNASAVEICDKFALFGRALITKNNTKLVQLKRCGGAKNSKQEAALNADPVDADGCWRVPVRAVEHKGDQSKLERLSTFAYEHILELVPAVEPKEQARTLPKLETSKTGRCDGRHCDDLSKLGPYDVHVMQFDSQNADRRNYVECSSACACDAGTCRNRAMQQGLHKVLGEHVAEQLTFGIDQFTRYRIARILSKEGELEVDGFVVRVLQPAMNAFLRECAQPEHAELKSAKILYKQPALNGNVGYLHSGDVDSLSGR